MRQPRETGKWPSSRKANLWWDQDGQIPEPTPRLQQTSQGPQLKETQHLNSQLVWSTLGVKCHVKTDTGMGIPRVPKQLGRGASCCGSVHTELWTRAESGLSDYWRNRRLPPQSTGNKSEDRNPSPSALSGPDDVRTGRTTHAN